MRRWQTVSLFELSELVCTKNVFYPILWFPTYLPQASSPLERSRQTEGQRKFFTPCYLSSFFSLSARGPTRRRNSTGLAELWGGWPIEQAERGFATSRLCIRRSDEDGTILAHNNTRFRLVHRKRGGTLRGLRIKWEIFILRKPLIPRSHSTT